ncbi:MAG TPA: T9SS type A sorting domain-containing protein, partial [Flavobacteriales bacterium]
GFEFEFTPVANCAGDDPQVLDKFIKPLTSNTPYISLNYVFNAVPLASNPNLGYWSVRIRPRYNGHTGEWGTPYVIAVNGTAPVTNMAMNDAPVASVLTTAESIESSIYPNPNTGEMVNLNITGITSNEVYVRVLDSMGREVYTNRYSVDGSLNTVVSFAKPLAQGIYMLELRAGVEVKTQRMVVTK